MVITHLAGRLIRDPVETTLHYYNPGLPSYVARIACCII